MDAVTNALAETFAWVAQSSLEASLVVLLILAARFVTPKRHATTLYSALWLVLVVHMLLPWRPESAISIANLLQSADTAPKIESLPVTIEFGPADSDIEPAAQKIPSVDFGAAATGTSSTGHLGVLIVSACWLAGLLYVLAQVLYRYIAYKRALPKTSGPADPAIQSLVDECRIAMGIRKAPRVLVTGHALSPALVGMFRPTLLIPESMLDRLTDAEWCCVISHELAHLKRHDIPLNWLTTLLQAIHWFNPILWYAFRKMRADREMACDALALASTDANRSADLGSALVKLLQAQPHPERLAGVAAILEGKSDLERRMNMIMRFNPAGQRWSIFPIATICLVAIAGLTNAQAPADDPPASEEKLIGNPTDNLIGYIRIESGDIEDVVDEIEAFGAQNNIAFTVTLSVFGVHFVSDAPGDISKFHDFVQKLGNPGGASDTVTQTIQFNYLLFDDINDKIEAFAAAEQIAFNAVSLETDRTLICTTDTLADFEKIQDFVRQLDKPLRQFSIEAIVIEAIMKDESQNNRDWLADVFSQQDAIQSIAENAAVSNLGVYVMGEGLDLAATIAAQVNAGAAELLASPFFVTVENKLARISITEEIPIKLPTGATAFEELRTILEFMPRVAHDESIILDVTVGHSKLVGYTSDAQPIPIISKREIVTTLRLLSGRSVILTNLRRDQSDDGNDRELLVFITCKFLSVLADLETQMKAGTISRTFAPR